MTEMTQPGGETTQALLDHCAAGLGLAERRIGASRRAVADAIAPGGKPEPAQLDAHQFALHGLAWQATYVGTLRCTLRWARNLREAGRLTEVEEAILRLGFAEYLNQLVGGIPMTQAEIVRPGDLGMPADISLAFLADPVLGRLSDPAVLNAARPAGKRGSGGAVRRCGR